MAPDAKRWVSRRLVRPLQQRERELEQLAAAAEKKGLLLQGADELRGLYTGPILLKTTNFICQVDTASGTGVIHDRLMLDTASLGKDHIPRPYGRNEHLTVRYSLANAPLVERHEQVVYLATKKKMQGPKLLYICRLEDFTSTPRFDERRGAP